MTLEVLIKQLPNINLIDFFKFWEDKQDIFMIKHDGPREKDKYTLIILAKNSRFESIRSDCSNLQIGLGKILIEYQEILKRFNA